MRRAELSKYKFSLNPKTKSYVEWILQHYREDKRQLEEYKQNLMPATTQNYSTDAVPVARSFLFEIYKTLKEKECKK